jgi:hypothetical protein
MKFILLSLILTCCTSQTKLVQVPTPPPQIVTKTIIKEVPRAVTRPGTEADKVLRDYRDQERRLPESNGYPNATPQQLKNIDNSNRNARNATQHLISKDGHSTPKDKQDAHDAIDNLSRAQDAPKSNPKTEDK